MAAASRALRCSRRERLRTIHVESLNRQTAEARAIGWAVGRGAGCAKVRTCERIVDPNTLRSVWQVVLAVPRRRD